MTWMILSPPEERVGRGSGRGAFSPRPSSTLHGTHHHGLMPRRELKNGGQIADWFAELGASLKAPDTLSLIGSAALL